MLACADALAFVDAGAAASPPEQSAHADAGGVQEISISKMPEEGMMTQPSGDGKDATKLENQSLSADGLGMLEPEHSKVRGQDMLAFRRTR